MSMCSALLILSSFAPLIEFSFHSKVSFLSSVIEEEFYLADREGKKVGILDLPQKMVK